jgi:hypothetical protein
MTKMGIEIKSRGPFVVFEYLFPDRVFMAVIETAADVISPSALLARETELYGADWPSAEVSRLDRVLKREGLIAVVAAVAALPSRVVVCAAGDLRTHLAWGGKLRSATQDHTYATDPLFASQSEGIPLEIRGSVTTRGIGPGSQAPPETADWRAASEYSVYICSSQIHRHRPPDSYFGELMTKGASAANLGGFFSRIDVGAE